MSKKIPARRTRNKKSTNEMLFVATASQGSLFQGPQRNGGSEIMAMAIQMQPNVGDMTEFGGYQESPKANAAAALGTGEGMILGPDECDVVRRKLQDLTNGQAAIYEASWVAQEKERHLAESRQKTKEAKRERDEAVRYRDNMIDSQCSGQLLLRF